MGRKGVSKRKPKKSGSTDNNNHGSSNARLPRRKPISAVTYERQGCSSR